MVVRLTRILRIIGQTLLLLCLVLIAYFSLCKIASGIAEVTGDKFMHSTAYAALGFSMYLSFMPLEKKVGKEKDMNIHLSNSHTFIILKLFFYGLAYGLLMELLQSFVGRSCSLMDLAADGIGLIVGFATCYLFLGFVNKLFSYLP